MKAIMNFYLLKKYQNLHNHIFHGFVYVALATELFFYFIGIPTPGIIFAIIFVVYEIPNIIIRSFFKSKQ